MPQWLYRAPGIIHCRTRRFRQWVQYHIHIIFFLIVCLNIQIFKTENSYKLCHCKLIITLSNGLIGKTNLELNFTAILNGHLHVYIIHPHPQIYTCRLFLFREQRILFQPCDIFFFKVHLISH